MLRLAPIALFTFKRPEHTRRAIEYLAKNPEFTASPLFIYCDGARNAAEADQVEKTRKLIRDFQHPNKTVIERDKNWGLANSVIYGVTELCERYGRVIVVEDDLIVSPVFLHYLNAALEYYADEPKVMQISGHMFPVHVTVPEDALFLPFTTSWGWATWDRAWKHFNPNATSGYEKLKNNNKLRDKFELTGSYPCFSMLKRQIEGTVDSWAIRWYLTVFFSEGLVLFPKQTLVLNDGFDGSGTNCKRPLLRTETIAGENIQYFPAVQVPDKAFSAVKDYLRKEQLVFNKLIKYGRALWARKMA